MAARNGGSTSKYFFTLKEAAAYIGVNPKTFYRYMKRAPNKGGPPRVRFGKGTYWRIPIDKFNIWINERTES